jgi:hypothetical protein
MWVKVAIIIELVLGEEGGEDGFRERKRKRERESGPSLSCIHALVQGLGVHDALWFGGFLQVSVQVTHEAAYGV